MAKIEFYAMFYTKSNRIHYYKQFDIIYITIIENLQMFGQLKALVFTLWQNLELNKRYKNNSKAHTLILCFYLGDRSNIIQKVVPIKTIKTFLHCKNCKLALVY